MPQGSVLGPVIFSMHTQPISETFRQRQMSYQFYADDSQLYKASAPENITDLIRSMEECIREVKSWMDSNKLKLNENKTELMLCGNTSGKNKKLPTVSLCINGCTIQSSVYVKNLGFYLNNTMSMEIQISNLCKVLTLYLKKIASIRDFLTFDVASKLVTTFILSRVDYCNSLLLGISRDKLHRLQVIQNSAAKLITRKKRMAHSSPILYELHWLPIEIRINYKTAMLCYKCLNDEAPQYLQDLLTIYVPSRTLRSSSDRTKLVVPKYRYKTIGERSFTVSGPKVWNSIPKNIRESPTIETFKSKLKHFLFTETYF